MFYTLVLSLSEVSWFSNHWRAGHFGAEISGEVCENLGKQNENSPYPGARPPEKAETSVIFMTMNH